MALRAMRLGRVDGVQSQRTAQEILALSNRLEMAGVDAEGQSTQVVEHIAVWHWPDSPLVRDPVRELGLAVQVDLTVTPIVLPKPDEATGFGVTDDVGPEPSLRVGPHAADPGGINWSGETPSHSATRSSSSRVNPFPSSRFETVLGS